MTGTTQGAVQRTMYTAGAIEKEIDYVADVTKIRTYLPLGISFDQSIFLQGSHEHFREAVDRLAAPIRCKA